MIPEGKSRSPLLPGQVLLLLAILIGGAWIFRTVRNPGIANSKAARPPDPALPQPPASKPPELPAPAIPPAPRMMAIRGRLMSSNAEPVPLAKIEIFALDLRKTLAHFSVETDANGAFRTDVRNRAG